MINVHNNLTRLGVALLVIINLWVVLPRVHAETSRNTLTLDNQSGDSALVQVIGPTKHTVAVPNGAERTVHVDAGEYYLLTRYGHSSDNYRYTKGESFDVTQTATQYSKTTITLHKVVAGNYTTKPISKEDFEKALGSVSDQNKLALDEKNQIEQSSYFRPLSGPGLIGLRYAEEEEFLFKIKNTDQAGYMAIIRDDELWGILLWMIIQEFSQKEEKRFLYHTGLIKIEHIKEIEILEENRDYINDVMINPYFKVNITLKDDKRYNAFVSAFDLIESEDKDNREIHKMKKGMTVTRIEK